MEIVTGIVALAECARPCGDRREDREIAARGPASAARLDPRQMAAASANVKTAQGISARGPVSAALVAMEPSSTRAIAASAIVRLRGTSIAPARLFATRKIARKASALAATGTVRLTGPALIAVESIAATTVKSRPNSTAVCTTISGAAARRGLARETGFLLARHSAEKTAALAR